MGEFIFQSELFKKIREQGADFILAADISRLPDEQNKGFPGAILFGIVLSKEYLRTVAADPEYVEKMKINNTINDDEFHLAEIKTDSIADYTESFIISSGFHAYSQSEENILKTGFYDKERNSTPLPHKTIAGYAGMGWIGKHNLLITPGYGSAISMCSVLTDVPLKSVFNEPEPSQCGNCDICVESCSVNAIKGNSWRDGISRDEIVDVFLCNSCLQCMVQCPWTQKYIGINS